MTAPSAFLKPADAARRLGVSPKSLRVWEDHGLVAPGRTRAGWRSYGSADMERAAAVLALRDIGLGLDAIGRVLDGEPDALGAALETHRLALEQQGHRLAGRLAAVRRLSADLAAAKTPSFGSIAALGTRAPKIAFDLPWPWGGERFELPVLPPLAFLTGPLFSGKTRLARAIAQSVDGARYLGPDRPAGMATPQPNGPAGAGSGKPLRTMLDRLASHGATPSDALAALVAALLDETASLIVVDMVEQDLDEPTQSALMADLRERPVTAPPLLLMTRSSAILDLETVDPAALVLYCPANHAPPVTVAPLPGAPGYEALAGCLAAPHVRARTAGVRAFREAAA